MRHLRIETNMPYPTQSELLEKIVTGLLPLLRDKFEYDPKVIESLIRQEGIAKGLCNGMSFLFLYSLEHKRGDPVDKVDNIVFFEEGLNLLMQTDFSALSNKPQSEYSATELDAIKKMDRLVQLLIIYQATSNNFDETLKADTHLTLIEHINTLTDIHVITSDARETLPTGKKPAEEHHLRQMQFLHNAMLSDDTKGRGVDFFQAVNNIDNPTKSINASNIVDPSMSTYNSFMVDISDRHSIAVKRSQSDPTCFVIYDPSHIMSKNSNPCVVKNTEVANFINTLGKALLGTEHDAELNIKVYPFNFSTPKNKLVM
jgi:hypothetical protein